VTDRYSSDVLAENWKTPKAAPAPAAPAELGLVVEELATGWCGAVTRVESGIVELEDRHGKRRSFPLGTGFLIDGEPVRLIAAVAASATSATGLRTASGSLAVERQRARVARSSRILVEGRHDAELIEKVWGADLRIEGVVVEYLEGIDDLDQLLRQYSPGPGRRIGVLVDHLVPGSKETRLVEAARRGPHAEFVHIVGHPYIDIWQAIRPEAVGIAAWPEIPRSIEWKKGICRSFGWPHQDQEDIARAWQRLLGRVTTYADLEPSLLGRVEELIDFVTAEADD
jgi:hypothetical protein